jgi:hypothetical protein
MKPRVTLLVLLLLSQLVVPAGVSALYGDYAAGSGSDVNLSTFRFTAEGYGGPLSKIATGTMRLRRHIGHFAVSGDVFCLNVTGNNAVIGGVITHSSVDLGGEDYFKLTVQDNADPGDASDRFQFTISATRPDCLFPDLNTLPIVEGDIEVVASTFPF